MIQIFHHTKDTGKILKKKKKKENKPIALNILFLSYDSEEVKLVYKSSYNKCKNQVILLIINDEANNYYYFAV